MSESLRGDAFEELFDDHAGGNSSADQSLADGGDAATDGDITGVGYTGGGGLGFEADLSCSFDETTSSRAGYTERVLRMRGEIVDVYGARVGIPDRADSHTQVHPVAVFLDLFEFLATRQASGNLT